MDAQVKLKDRLPHGAIKDIAKLVGVSTVVVGAVVNGKVEVKRGEGLVRICSEDLEAKIKSIASSIIKQRESILARAMEQVQELTSTYPLSSKNL